MREDAMTRLDALRQQERVGLDQLRRLEAETIAIRDTLLRIRGAILVLEELLGAAEGATGGEGGRDGAGC
jgi:hypothetical protein